MKLEKINETKLKIIFNSEELEENNISLHSFLSNSLESQKFFWAILEIANEDLNFNTYNCKISYETFSFENKTFIIFLTKEKDISNLSIDSDSFSNTSGNFFQVLKNDTISQNSGFFFKNNKLTKYRKNIIYTFNSLEELFDFCKYLNNSFSPFNLESNLYQYKDIYFLEFSLENTSLLKENIIEKLELVSSDIKDQFDFSEEVWIRLKEFSDLLIEKNAVSILS